MKSLNKQIITIVIGVAPLFTIYNPYGNTEPLPILTDCPGSGCENQVYKRMIVIVETPAADGTGTIIGRRDGTLTFLTSGHVIPQGSKLSEFTLFSPLKKVRFKLASIAYPLGKKVDIAVGTFKVPAGEDDFMTAYMPTLYCEATTSGILRNWCVDSLGARMGGYSIPSKGITLPVFRFNEFALQDRAYGNQKGYEFIYEAATYPGMSGSPIFADYDKNLDHNYRCSSRGLYYGLVAIHGQSESYERQGNNLGRSGISLGVPVDLIKEYLLNNAESLGIPRTSRQALNDFCYNIGRP